MTPTNEFCVRCGESLCYILYCDPFYGGCGFIIECNDLPSTTRCPYCKGPLEEKLHCHPEYGGCEYIEEAENSS